MKELVELNKKISDLSARIDGSLMSGTKEIAKELTAIHNQLTEYLSTSKTLPESGVELYYVRSGDIDEQKHIMANSRKEAIIKFMNNTEEVYHTRIFARKLENIEDIIGLNLL